MSSSSNSIKDVQNADGPNDRDGKMLKLIGQWVRRRMQNTGWS